MLELISGLPDNVVGFAVHGDVTRDDYEQRLKPAVGRALAKHDKIRMLHVFGADLKSYSPAALWEDTKLTVHLTGFERIAVVADPPWTERAVDALGHLIPGELEVFDLAHEEEAKAWVSAKGW